MYNAKGISNFGCLSKIIHPIKLYFLGHRGHKKCIMQYLKSDHAKNP